MRLAILMMFSACIAPAMAVDPLELPLWKGNPPGMVEGATPGADDGTGRWRNVGIPGMLV